MIECPVDHPALTRLFDPRTPNNPALWSVLQGRHSGIAFVDDLNSPSQCVLRTDALLTYASCHVCQNTLDEAIGHFRRNGRIWLVRCSGDPPAPQGYRVLPRLEFYDVDLQSPNLVNFRSSLPDGYEMHDIDRALLESCEWRDDMAFYCGSLENFLRHGIGMCLMHGEEIIVEAYASPIGSTYAEIGAITHEPYRGMGLASIAVAYLIKALEKRSYQAYWSCDIDNLASARVARKLGFRVEKPYEIWEYMPNAI